MLLMFSYLSRATDPKSIDEFCKIEKIGNEQCAKIKSEMTTKVENLPASSVGA